jgi:hypothetical protein
MSTSYIELLIRVDGAHAGMKKEMIKSTKSNRVYLELIIRTLYIMRMHCTRRNPTPNAESEANSTFAPLFFAPIPVEDLK